MKNKNLLIGGAVVVGGLLFFYFRNKRSTDNGEERSISGGNGAGSGSGTGAGTGAGSGTGVSGGGSVSPTPPTGTTTPPTGTSTSLPPITQLTKFELEKRMLKDCGAKPLFKGGARNSYDKCLAEKKAILRSQGLISFNGLSEDNTSRLDFDGNIID